MKNRLTPTVIWDAKECISSNAYTAVENCVKIQDIWYVKTRLFLIVHTAITNSVYIPVRTHLHKK